MSRFTATPAAHMRRARTAFSAMVAAMTAVAAAAVVTVSLGGVASAAPAPPPFEPDPNSLGGLVFHNAAGEVITSGNTTDAPFAASVQATGSGRLGDSKATLFGYLPNSGLATGSWSGEALSASTSYAPIGAPIVSLNTTDTKLSTLQSDFPNLATDAYQGLYQLRLKTSGPGQSAGPNYYAADILITGTTWTVVFPPVAVFTPAVPARLLETRGERSTIDGLFNNVGFLPAGTVTELTVAGRGGVPGDATAAALNVTVTEPSAAGFITVYPCGAAQPVASNLNYVAGETIANAVVAKIGTDGKVCFFNSQPTHLVVDANGSYPAGSPYEPLVPGRLLETRGDRETVDGLFNNTGPVAANSVTELTVAGRGGVSPTATSAVLNVTVTEPAAAGFITVYPCGASQPVASNLNFVAGQTIANAVISQIGTDGKVCLFSSQATQLIVDVNGDYLAGSAYVPLVPGRLLETRGDRETVDGQFNNTGPVGVNTVTELTVAGRGGVSGTATSAVLNVTVTEPAGPGFITVYPCGADQPLASNLNFVAGQTIANAAVSQIGTDGKVCLFSSQATQFIVDVNGYYP